MKSIYTLVDDIYSLVQTKGWMTDEYADLLSRNIRVRFEARFGTASKDAKKPTLRLSRMGPVCPKVLWHSIHTPELAEPLPPWAEIKFTFGDILEAVALTYSRASGHEVVGEQDELKLDGIVGHRDCVIDGCVVDVKSCSSRAFVKYKTKTLHQDDSFGYLDQLDGYVLASADDPLVRVKDKGYILAIDKQLGRMVLYEHTIRAEAIRRRIKEYKRIVDRDGPPACLCGTVRIGASGNIGLDTKASYSAFKHCCFPGLRTFLYSDGPRHLVKVVRLPDVPELRRGDATRMVKES